MVEDGRFLSSQHIQSLIAKLMVRGIGAIGVGGVRVVKGGRGGSSLNLSWTMYTYLPYNIS